MNKVEQKQQILRDNGFDQKKLDMLMALAFEEFMEKLEDDLTNLELEDLENLENEMKSIDFNKIIQGSESSDVDFLKKVYGLNYRNVVEDFIADYLQDAIDQIGIVKDIMNRMQSGDTSIVDQHNANPNKQAVEEAAKLVQDL